MNKTTKHYFIDLFKRKKKILALYTFICFMGYPFIEIGNLIINEKASQFISITQTSFILALCVLGILAAVLPIFTFKFSHTKKHVDTYFAIPINRNHLFKAHFIAPILGTCIPILVNYLIGGIILVIFTGEFMLYFELLILLLLAFAIFAVVYSINTYFVLNTNNVLDSVIITAGILVIPLIFSSAVSIFIDSQIVRTGMVEIYPITDEIIKLLLPYTGFVLIADAIENLYHILVIDFESIEWFYILYYFVLGIVFYYLSKKAFKNKKGENAEQLTTSFLTYPLMINVGLVSLVLIFNIIQMEFITAVLVLISLFVAYFIAQAIANRSMTINIKMVLRFIALIVVVNGFNYISKQTEFFGINRQVIDYTKYDYVEIEYNSFNDKYAEIGEDGEVMYPERLFYRIDVNELKGNEEKLFELFEEYQKERSIAFKETGSIWRDSVLGSVSISYITKSGYNKIVDRSAWFDLTYNEEIQLLELLNELKDESY